MYIGSLNPIEGNIFDAKILSGVSIATISPSSIKMILSKSRFNISSIRCSIITIVLLYCLCIFLISSIVCKLLAGSKFANGSSNNNIGAFVVNKPAKETVCFCPPDNSCGLCL